jgi:hypothetical protein
MPSSVVRRSRNWGIDDPKKFKRTLCPMHSLESYLGYASPAQGDERHCGEAGAQRTMFLLFRSARRPRPHVPEQLRARYTVRALGIPGNRFSGTFPLWPTYQGGQNEARSFCARRAQHTPHLDTTIPSEKSPEQATNSCRFMGSVM